MEVETENSTSEIPESQAMTISNLVLTDHDYTSQDIFLLKDLPANIFSKLLGMLKQNDKNNLRLTCRCMNDRVTQVDLSLRDWSIIVKADNYQITLDVLTAGIAKLVSVQTNPKINLHLNLFSNSLRALGSSERATIIKKLFKEFGRYVTRLDLTIYGEETYLLEPQYHLPNLETFFVESSPSIKDLGLFRVSTREKCVIFEDFLVAHGMTLKNLEVSGLWDVNISGSKFYPLLSLEVLNLTRSMSCTLQNMITISGMYISTLELYDVIGDDATGELCDLPNIKHLHIDARSMGYFEFVRRNTKNMESLIFFCDDRNKDFFPQDLNEFENLKLLEVNCPVLNNAILQKCTQSLEYLYVPKQEMPKNWNEINLNLPIGLPNLKDLCVSGSERWSINMIKKNCASLEYLIIFGYKELDDFLDGSAEDEDIGDDDDFHPVGNGIIANAALPHPFGNGANPQPFGNDIIANGANPHPIGNGVIANAANPIVNAFPLFGNQDNLNHNQIMVQMNQLIGGGIHPIGNNDDIMDDDNDAEHLDDNDSSDDDDSSDEENDNMENGVEFPDNDSEDETGETEYCWPDLVAINCRFPNLKMLLLPDCTEPSIVESLAAKCPPDVKVVTDKKLVGEAVKARIYQSYSYKRYIRMMHTSLSSLFQFNR